jgi:hypothetical protein
MGPLGRTLLTLTAILAAAWTPTSLRAQEDAREEVLAVVRTLFDGMREKDREKLVSVFHTDARLHTAGADGQGNPVTRATPVDAFIANVVAGEAYVDEVTFDETVMFDGNLAMAWTPYNVFVNGDFQHCGVDLFAMTRTDAGWKILQIVDTRTRQGCDPERRG